MNEKLCGRCQTIKPLTEFFKDKNRKHGVQPACKICSNVYRRKWIDNNKDKILETTTAYRKNNVEKVKKAQKAWAKKNPIKTANYQHERKAKLKKNGTFKVSVKELKNLYESECFYCKTVTNIEIDHVIPIDRGGRHSIGNLVAACRSCNASKNNKLLIEWIFSKTIV